MINFTKVDEPVDAMQVVAKAVDLGGLVIKLFQAVNEVGEVSYIDQVTLLQDLLDLRSLEKSSQCFQGHACIHLADVYFD
jgi:hypothetical protein